MAYTQQQIINQFNNKHNHFYDYSNVIYKGTHDKVEIICPIHKGFFQTPAKHKKGRGCPKCGVIKSDNAKWIKQNEIIKQFENKHNKNLYNYSKVVYKGIQEEVIIHCNTCNKDFNQTPDHHKRGSGCTHCAIDNHRYHNINTYKNRPTTLYYIEFNGLYKIGLTMKSIKQRYSSELKQGLNINIIKEWNFNDGSIAYRLEQQILEDNKDIQYHGKKILVSGNTELLTCNILPQIEHLVSL